MKKTNNKVMKVGFKERIYHQIETLLGNVNILNSHKESLEKNLENSPSDNTIIQLNNLNVARAEIFTRIGLQLSILGDQSLALAYLDDAIATDPGNIFAPLSKAELLLDLGQYKESVLSYNIVLFINPNTIIAHSNKGVALSSMGEYVTALEEFDAAIKFNPGNYVIWQNKSHVLLRLGKNDEALACFQEVLKLQLQNAAEQPDIISGFKLRGLEYSCGERQKLKQLLLKIPNVEPSERQAKKLKYSEVESIRSKPLKKELEKTQEETQEKTSEQTNLSKSLPLSENLSEVDLSTKYSFLTEENINDLWFDNVFND